MGIAGVATFRTANVRGQRTPEGDDPHGVKGEQYPSGIGARLPGGLVIAGEMLDDPPGNGGQIDILRRAPTKRERVVEGKRVEFGGGRVIKKKKSKDDR